MINLIKVILGTVFILAIFFGPAGTFNWPEAWIYLLMTVVYAVPTVLYLKKHNPELIKRRQKFIPEKGWDAVFTYATVVIFVIFLVILGLDAVRFGWSVVPFWLKTISFVGIGLSFAILFLVLKENAYLLRIVKIEKGHKLVTTGPYSVVRHPMYVAVILQFTLFPLALGSFWALPLALLIDIFIIIRTILEEKTLTEDLEGYKEYTEKVRYRMMPGIW